MKLLLVLPKDRTYQYRGSFLRSIAYAPLTLTTLAAMVPPELQADIELVDEGVERSDYAGDYDLAGITCCASSSPRAYELSARFRERGIFTVLGGAHPTLMPQEALRHADAVVAGIADESWPRLLRDWRAGCAGGLYRSDPSDFIHPPVPRRDLQRRGLYLGTPTVLAAMGCGNHCGFCSIHSLWGSRFRREVSEVVAEIAGLGSRKVLFLDPNLTGDPDYAKALFHGLLPLGIRWAGLAGVDLVRDRELLELAVRSGCEGLLMGFETFSPTSLEAAGKERNDPRGYKQVVELLHRHGIRVLGTFILGLDGDTPASIRRTVTQIDELGLDLVRFSVLTPFPGTPLFDAFRRDGRILTEDWYHYDQEQVVFQPEHMGPGELQELLHEVWRRSTTLGRILRRTWQAEGHRATLLAANLGFRHYARKLGEIQA